MCTHESVGRVHALKQLLRVIIKTIQAGGGHCCRVQNGMLNFIQQLKVLNENEMALDIL